MNKLYLARDVVSRSVSPENFTGEAGRGGMATEGTGARCARELGQGWKVSPSVVIPAGTTFTLADIHEQGVIRHIWITDAAPRNRLLVLRIYWDGAEKPSVEAPLNDFFASADIMDYRQMTSAMVCVNPRRALNCYWEMPFRSQAKLTLENISDGDITVYYQIDYTVEKVEDNAMYFHAQFRRKNPLPYKEVYTLLEGITGQGVYVGTYMFWAVRENGWWGEGEIKFYMDGDDAFPTICGTGTEDYFCGSYDFSDGKEYAEYCTPYAGVNKIMRGDGHYSPQQRFSMYRWHIVDPACFRKDLRVTIQALGWRSGTRYLPLQDDISSVAYYYLDHCADVTGTLPDADGLEIIGR